MEFLKKSFNSTLKQTKLLTSITIDINKEKHQFD